MKRALVGLCWVLMSLFLPSGTASAQPVREGRMIITVVDQSGGVIPNATVAVIGVDDNTRKATIAPVKTSDKGVAIVEHVTPGRYSIRAEFPGFEMGLVRDVRVRAGDSKHAVVLPLAKVAEEITVGRDAQTAASDRAGTFGTALTREQVEALSDDPDELRRQLQDMAGPGAAIRVDSFEGQQLPPKAQIKAVHITRDMFAAENHYAGGMFIDIITQPGMGPLRGSTNFGFYDSALEGRNPLIAKKGPARTGNFGGNIGGSLIKGKSSFSVGFNRSSSYRTPNLYAQTSSSSARRSENLNLRTPSSYYFMSALFDYALTKDQTLRVSYNENGFSDENQGVGSYDMAERAYSTENRGRFLRVQEAGPIGRRFFINTRFSLNWSDSTTVSSVEAPTIQVIDAFTSGGAQRMGGSHNRAFTLNSDLDYVRGIHSLRAGVQFDGGRYRSDDWSNYLGTYTFGSLEDYEAGKPRSYTRRLGDPNIAYFNLQGAFYLQDDIRVKKGLTLSPGVRFEAQTHVKDVLNAGPRFGITWAPFKGGKTTFRASAGRFLDWLSSGTYSQTLRVDGFHQQELNIVDPDYPDPGTLGLIPPTNRYLLSSDVRMASNSRVSAGIDQQISKILRIGATYAHVRTDHVLVGSNLNAPVEGVRPNPEFANVIETVADGRSRSHSLSTNFSLNLSGPSMGPATTGPRFSWRRGLSVNAYYYVGKSENNTEGAFSIPASGNLATEWGPSSGDIRQRVSFNVYTNALKNLSANISMSASTGAPYTIRTGRDDNGDLMFNDRPEGVGRNTVRARGQWNSYGYFTYTVGFGKRRVPLPPGIMITSSGGGLTVGTAPQQDAPRYRMMFRVSAQNLTNHANYVGYSGLMTSPFFLQPTRVEGVRQITLNVGFSF